MGTQRKHSSYQVRPDKLTTAEVEKLYPEESVIVYDTDRKVHLFRNGDQWVSSDATELTQGWQDFADLTTQATPIEQTSVDGGQVQLTTDNAGTLTDGNTTQNSETTLGGVNDIWNTSSNTIQFGGTGLITNDTIDARIHFEISPNIVPQNFKLVFEFYDDVNGGGNKVFELVSAVQSVFENAGTFVEMLIERRFFIGESIKDGSAIVKLEGSSSFEVKMKGFNFEIRR
jgi:hypothetical protein